MFSVSPEKVATPLDAVTVSVPPRVAPPGLLASATVTVPLKEEMGLPELSSASTVRPNGLPAVTLAGGCCVTTSCDVVRVATPIAFVPASANQRLPSGPAVIPFGGVGVRDGVLGDGVGRRVDRPILPAACLGEPEVAVGACRDPARMERRWGWRTR